MIECHQVTKSYRRGNREVAALKGVDLQVAAGESVALLGRSGSGKSSLLNLMAGLDRPTSGQLKINGRELSRLSSRALSAYRRRDIGIVFQSFRLIPQRTALENVELPLTLDGVSRGERRRRATEALEQVGLRDRLGHRPEELSGGEQQRVALARAIVHRPPLLLADEPTGNLDAATAETVLALLNQLTPDGRMTLFVITHDAWVSRSIARSTLHLADGVIVPEAALDTAKLSPRDGEFPEAEA